LSRQIIYKTYRQGRGSFVGHGLAAGVGHVVLIKIEAGEAGAVNATTDSSGEQENVHWIALKWRGEGCRKRRIAQAIL
jgi:hypothetical protein